MHSNSLVVFPGILICVFKLGLLTENMEKKTYVQLKTALPVICLELFIWGRGITCVFYTKLKPRATDD